MTIRDEQREEEFSQAAMLQRLRRVLRRVSSRSNLGERVPQRVKMLLRGIGGQEETIGTCQDIDVGSLGT